MIVTPNLPFHSDYFSNRQNLQNLRSNITTLISNDIQTLQSLLGAVQNTLAHPQIFTNFSGYSQTYKKQKELQLFKYLSEQNRDRSDTVSGLAQIIIQMIDFIEEEQQKHQTAIYSYQRKIDQLTDAMNQMSYNKSLVENDIQILKQQLQCAQIEIDKLIQERNYFNQNQLVSSELKEQLHNFKIELLENQLTKLKNTLSLFNQSHQLSKASLTFPQYSKTLKYTYSLDHFSFPKTCNQCTDVTNKLHIQDNKSGKCKKKGKQQYEQSQDSCYKTFKTPKKTARYLTQNQKSQANFDEEEAKQFESFQQTSKLNHKKSTSQLSYLEKDEPSQVNQLQINSNSQQTEKAHRLCSDFSHKSFFYEILPQADQSQPGKLIYITQDENQNQSSSSINNIEFDFSKLALTLETKDSEISSKDIAKNNFSEIVIQNQPKLDKKSLFKSMLFEPKVPTTMRASAIQKQVIKEEKPQSKGLYHFLENFIVKNRVKRTTQKANSGLNKFLI